MWNLVNYQRGWGSSLKVEGFEEPVVLPGMVREEPCNTK